MTAALTSALTTARTALSPTARRLLMVATIKLAVLAALAASGLPGHAYDSAAQTALQTFHQARSGDEGRIDSAAEQLQAASRAHPDDPLLMAYAGSATTLQARATLLPWKKMRYAEDGLALQDKALQLLTPAHDAALHDGVPVSLETRFTVASTFIALPSMFNRRERGLRLLRELSDSPLTTSSPGGFAGQIWLMAAREAARDGLKADARRWAEQAVARKTPQAGAAQALLKELGA